MKYTGYSKAEIQETVERKRPKYGKTKNVVKADYEPINSAEVKKKQLAEKQKEFWETYIKEINARWKKIKSSSFKCDISKWHIFMITPVGKVEMSNSDKENMIKEVNKYIAEELNKRWVYNDKMTNTILRCGYKKEYISSVLNQLSTHHDIETIYERGYFKNLNWNITTLELDPKTRETSIHNFLILKEQILMNQYNPLYNSKINTTQTKQIKQD
jgi:hypothetical protein